MFNQVNAYFTSEEFLKDKTPINENLDIKKVVPFLGNAQEVWIQPLLGTALYNRLQEGIVNQNLTPSEEQLIRILRPAHAYYTVFTALPFIAVELRNAGLVRSANENIQPAEYSFYKELLNQVKNTAEFYATRVTQFLCDNKSVYPLWTDSTGIASKKTSSFNGGFYYKKPSCSCKKDCNCK